MTYQPQPLKLEEIELPEELNRLVEELAANQHDIWAINKIKNGFIYGEKNSEPLFESGILKIAGTHKDLLPYEQLPENIKEYDRQNVIGTIKAILAMGYTIVKQEKI